MKKIYSYILFITCLFTVSQQLFSQSYSSSANPTLFSSGLLTGLAWQDEAYAAINDNQRCHAGMQINLKFSVNTDHLLTEGYGFNIPSSAVIKGIEVRMEKRAQGVVGFSSVTDNSLQLLKNGELVGENRANNYIWAPTDMTVSYGDSDDLWGTEWTPADINSSTFGCSFSAKLTAGVAGVYLEAQIDKMEIIVHYSVATANASLLYFDAFLMEDRSVKLKWITETEQNTDHFVIQHSTDAINWNDKARIKGAGNSENPVIYECNDKEAVTGLCYYRLKQVDIDGSEHLHNKASVNIMRTRGSISLPPNPVKDRLLFKCLKETDASLVIYLYDMKWNQVKKSEEKQLRKNVESPVEMEIPELAKGIYFYKAVMGDEVLTGQIVKED